MSKITRTTLPESTIPAQQPAALVAGRHPVARALQHDIIRAAGAVRSMPDRGSLMEADVSVAAYAAVVCTGRTPADALQSAANWSKEASGAEIHSMHMARVPGHREDVVEFSITMSVSFPDAHGEYTGDTHHAVPLPYVLPIGADTEQSRT